MNSFGFWLSWVVVLVEKNNRMPYCWKQDRLWPGHLLTLLWVWSIAVRYWKAEQLLAQTAHLRAANITFPLCDL